MGDDFTIQDNSFKHKGYKGAAHKEHKVNFLCAFFAFPFFVDFVVSLQEFAWPEFLQ